MKSLQLLFCILLTWLFASPSSAQTTVQDDRGWLEFQDEVNELIFQAYTFPEDSYEIRLMLTELLGYEGSQVFTDEEAKMLEEFEELMGFTPTHLPVLQLDLTLSRYFLDGTASVEYARFWLRLSDGKILHNLIGLRATSTKPVYDEQSFEDTFAKVSSHWLIMSRHERDWVELSHNSQRFDDGYFSSTSNYFYEPGVPSAHDRATDPGITLIEDVALGVWEGDGSPVELGTAGTFMQIAVGFAPFWGQLADGRDTYIALENVIASGGATGKGALALSLVGWVPGFGDAIKGGTRLGNKGLDATKGMLKAAGPIAALSKADKATLKKADEFFNKKSKTDLKPAKSKSPPGDSPSATKNTDGSESGRSGSGGNPAKPPWLSWNQYEKVTISGKEYAKVGNRLYTRHAVERTYPSGLGKAAGGVKGRSVSPSFIDEVLTSGKSTKEFTTGPLGRPVLVTYWVLLK